MAIGQYLSKGQAQEGSGRLSNFYMVDNCEIIKMSFPKILDFRRELKIPSEAPTKYK